MSFTAQPFDLDSEQLEFRDVLRRFFEAHAPMAEVRRVVDGEGSLAPELWKQACQELGLPGLAIPEACGGQGFGLAELALALGEAGRCLAPLPLFASAGLAGRTVAAVAGRDAERWLRPIAEGSIATLAWQEHAQVWRPRDASLVARPDGAQVRLSGEKRFVLAGLEAERFFVVARAPDSQGARGVGLFAVERNAPGVELRAVSTLDVTRDLATLVLEGAPATAVGEPGNACAALERALDEATALLCAEMVGGMEQVLETAVDYAANRFQFGRAIGSFQAIKHKCADMLIDFEGARTATRAALEAWAAQDDEAPILTSVAKSHASQAYVRMATENLQVHGGVGYTWEYDAHLYFRRAQSCQVLLGEPALHHERLAQALAAGEGA